MHKVRITFDHPSSLVIDLNDEQYAAAMREDSWEDFYSMMELKLSDHLFGTTYIDDIRDVDG